MIFFLLLIIGVLFAYEENKLCVSSKIELSTRHVFFGARFLCACMLALCALRGVEVGIDTEHYYESFYSGTERYVELGYWLFRQISLCFSNSFQVFLTLYAIAAIVPLFYTLKRDSWNISFSLLIYLTFSNFFYPETFNTIRATASIGLFLLALSFFVRHKKCRALAAAFISVIFHNSAVIAIFIAIVTMSIRELPRKIAYVSLLCSLVCGFMLEYSFAEYAEMLALWMSNMTGEGVEYYSRYVTSFEETDFNMVGTLSIMLPFTLFALLLYNEENAKKLMYKLFLVGTILSNIFISVTLIYRITMFFTVLIIILLPNTIKRYSDVKSKYLLSLTAFMLLWYVYKLFFTTSDNMAGILPYKFFFE